MTGAVTAARRGLYVIACPDDQVYLDYRQSERSDEPIPVAVPVTVETAYGFDPVPPELTDAEREHVLGGQANIWTEHMDSPRTVDYFAFPASAPSPRHCGAPASAGTRSSAAAWTTIWPAWTPSESSTAARPVPCRGRPVRASWDGRRRSPSGRHSSTYSWPTSSPEPGSPQGIDDPAGGFGREEAAGHAGTACRPGRTPRPGIRFGFTFTFGRSPAGPGSLTSASLVRPELGSHAGPAHRAACGGQRGHFLPCRIQRTRRQRLLVGQVRHHSGHRQLGADEVDVLLGHALLAEVGP